MKQTPQTFDLVILGGGCAGLSLAARLAVAESPLRVALVEARDHYTEDRTWCGWRLQPHFFNDCRVAEWNRWYLSEGGRILERSSQSYPYEMLNALMVYNKALDAITRSRNISLHLAVRAEHVRENAHNVEIELATGQFLEARWVVDTRPVRAEVRTPWLWQSFVGIVAQLEGQEVALERSQPMLMDFQSGTPGLVDFMYILPMGGRRYLCEYTRFAPEKATPFDLENRLGQWLTQHAAGGWRGLRRESGDLPMAKVQPPNTGRVVHAGASGGSLRLATGYAFHNIQRWADECTTELLHNRKPVGPRRNGVLEWMDELFLRVLQRKDVVPAHVMWALFAKSDPDSLVRFLSGQPRLTDYWPVVKGLPWNKFIGTAARNFAGLRSA